MQAINSAAGTDRSQAMEDLRRRFNPEGSLLRRQQMRMLDILLEVD